MSKVSDAYGKMSMCCPEWLFGRLIAVNWSWCSAMRLVRRKTGVEVNFRAFIDKFGDDKRACGHWLWEKHKLEYQRIWDEVHAD